jgi:Zn-dependent peptidase ImmA (M78 family)
MNPAAHNSTWRSLVVRQFWKSVGGRGPEDSVLRICEKMRRQLKTNAPPFQSDRYEYAAMVGARVIEKNIPNGKLQGILSRCGDECLIVVDKGDSPERRSFTVCHEVGHIQMLREAESLLAKDRVSQLKGGDEEERLSNAFAVNLLRPKQEFKAAALPLTPSMGSLLRLSALFRASVEAVARRSVELNIWPCALLWCAPEKLHGGAYAVKITDFMYAAQITGPTLSRRSLVRWGVDSVCEAYNNKGISSRPTTVRFHSPSSRTVEEWHLECMYRGDRQGASVLALMVFQKHF